MSCRSCPFQHLPIPCWHSKVPYSTLVNPHLHCAPTPLVPFETLYTSRACSWPPDLLYKSRLIHQVPFGSRSGPLWVPFCVPLALICALCLPLTYSGRLDLTFSISSWPYTETYVTTWTSQSSTQNHPNVVLRHVPLAFWTVSPIHADASKSPTWAFTHLLQYVTADSAWLHFPHLAISTYLCWLSSAPK